MLNSRNISCPSCHASFNLNENDYAYIRSQVKDSEIELALKKYQNLAKTEKENAISLAIEKTRKEMQQLITAEQKKVENLNLEKKLAKEQEAVNLTNSTSEKDKQIDNLTNDLAKAKTSQEELISKLGISHELALEKQKINMKEVINDLKLKNQTINSNIESQAKEHALKLKNLKDNHSLVVNDLTTEIERVKHMKSNLSTKMVGQTLEEHVEIEFESVRADAYRGAIFKKDTQAKYGTMGDFIFKNISEDGIEFVSAMIECKNENEADTQSKKQQISKFFNKLDKDRINKGCDYAILITTCEPNNEFYNRGIVEVLDYQNMYVCRPNFFRPMISLINNLGMKTLQEKRELKIVRSQNVDLINFEENLDSFKKTFGVNIKRASDNFSLAIKEITTTIDNLEKTKNYLEKVQDNLRIGNGKAQGITIKKLTKGNPVMKRLFELIQEEKNNNV